ncbi:phosphoribosylglycinamide formyltransferase [Erysipelotrichaceae bacterium MTC7]|nr:phosphoribosylglycinamide formyltransferase [Erysipelotrichaceae bacterium MTC7]
MVNVAIFASGSGSNFENLVKATYKHADIKLLVVDKENAYAITRANKLGIPYVFVNPKAFASKEDYETQILTYLQAYDITLIALAGYMRFIGKVLLENYPNGIINLHPAYLPEFPGAHSIQDAYDAKVKATGVTIHFVDDGVDTGPIIHQERIDIDPAWSLENLEEEVHKMEYDMFPRILDSVCKEVAHEKSSN